MRLVPRLLPTVIAASAIMLTFRVGLIWHDAGEAFAESAANAPTAAPDKPAAPDKLAPSDKSAAADKPAPAAPKFSAAEVGVLQELSKRRAELDQRAEDLDRRELLLKAAEQRVDEKIAKLQQIQAQVDASLGKVEQADEDRLKSLVHIYESMKPQEAAVIFSGMDMPQLLQLLTRMKDLKTAPILAAMSPDKARAITMALTQRKDVPDPKTN